jgi:DNA-binding MarR family transcriptional regulator
MKTKPEATSDLTPDGRLEEGVMAPIVGYQIAQATVTTNQVFDAVMTTGPGLRAVEFTVLALVQANPRLTAGQLAKALAVTPPNITMWLDRLEARGMVERERSTTDRRAQHVRATRLGASTADKAARLLVAAEQEALAPLTPGERAMLMELLHKVARCRARVAPPAAGKKA